MFTPGAVESPGGPGPSIPSPLALPQHCPPPPPQPPALLHPLLGQGTPAPPWGASPASTSARGCLHGALLWWTLLDVLLQSSAWNHCCDKKPFLVWARCVVWSSPASFCVVTHKLCPVGVGSEVIPSVAGTSHEFVPSSAPKSTRPGHVHTACALAPVCTLITTSYPNSRENNAAHVQHHCLQFVFLHRYRPVYRPVSKSKHALTAWAMPAAPQTHRVLGVVTLGCCSYHHSRHKLATSSTSQCQDVLSGGGWYDICRPIVCCPWFLGNWCSGAFLHLKFQWENDSVHQMPV